MTVYVKRALAVVERHHIQAAYKSYVFGIKLVAVVRSNLPLSNVVGSLGSV